SSSNPTQQGNFNFTLSVTDAVSTNKQKPFSITVVAPPTPLPFFDDFTTDQVWQFTNPWSRGQATAWSQTTPPGSEPGNDVTGNGWILGDTIGEPYQLNPPTIHWAASPLVNCSTASVVRLRFWRFAGFATDANAWIQVTNDGVNWHDVWEKNGGGGA